MKKFIIFILVVILTTSLVCACGERPEVVDKEPVDVRYTEAHTELKPFTYCIPAGNMVVPVTTYRPVKYPEKWEIQWLFFYSDNSESHRWVECTEQEYLAVKEYLDSGSTNGFRELDGDSDEVH